MVFLGIRGDFSWFSAVFRFGLRQPRFADQVGWFFRSP